MMRAAEWINVFFLSFFAVLAWLGPWPRHVRGRVTAMGAAGIGAILGPKFLGGVLAPGTISAVEDWLPAPLMLLVYWQAGQFQREPNEKLQAMLARFDRRVLATALRHRAGARIRAWVAGYFELAYLFCYLLVPLGVAVLYGIGRKDYADEYWTIILPPTYLCYPLLPFAQTPPPRMLESDDYFGAPAGSIRALNLRILQHASIQVNTFPSAHVASTVAAALALLHVSTVAGLAFLWVAISIGVGAVFGRYHYAADALLAALLALAAFLLETLLRS